MARPVDWPLQPVRALVPDYVSVPVQGPGRRQLCPSYPLCAGATACRWGPCGPRWRTLPVSSPARLS